MRSRKSRSSRWFLAVGAVVFLALVLVVYFVQQRGSKPAAQDETARGAPSGSVASPPLFSAELPPRTATGSTRENKPAQKPAAGDASSEALGRAARVIREKATLTEALAVARPSMVDAPGRLDPGTALLALWASEHLTWTALDAVPETTAALFKRDPTEERGKRLCAEGAVLDIRAERDLDARMRLDRTAPLLAGSLGDRGIPEPVGDLINPLPGREDHTLVVPGGKVYFATVEVAVEDRFRRERQKSPSQRTIGSTVPFYASALLVGEMGTIVEGSRARLCGILTGVTTYDRVSDSQHLLSHRLVGMLDLEANRKSAKLLPSPAATPPAPTASAPRR